MGPIAPKFHDFLGYNPHTHILVTDGCFYGDKGMGLAGLAFWRKR